ncbi:hypothetical protein BGZ61DRAFT_455742 [Ilyonectria robusta]|uniref:uncharacterized protein n=1 Tax=Ilyonectria robusta TaxID=1079257 RepID=UPI001E8E60CB|nr:uncharacterized protein BGZ61DRAFT_455742 [Ilyonectria robusta]KAH8684172.1 hypothetical protein BGZ61DRAFT_455742 [Ilyonectria robusta]
MRSISALARPLGIGAERRKSLDPGALERWRLPLFQPPGPFFQGPSSRPLQRRPRSVRWRPLGGDPVAQRWPAPRASPKVGRSVAMLSLSPSRRTVRNQLASFAPNLAGPLFQPSEPGEPASPGGLPYAGRHSFSAASPCQGRRCWIWTKTRHTRDGGGHTDPDSAMSNVR